MLGCRRGSLEENSILMQIALLSQSVSKLQDIYPISKYNNIPATDHIPVFYTGMPLCNKPLLVFFLILC